ncbi:MAG: hypothetical protein RL380_1631 [Verrucomicrobiota bacterium]|jgi:hypothetical protein
MNPANQPPEAPASRTALLFRMVIIVALLGSLFVLQWSYTQLLTPRLKKSRELSSTINRLASEADVLGNQWPKTNANFVTHQFGLAQSQSFADQPEAEAWLARLKDQVNPLVLDLKTEFNSTTTQTVAAHRLITLPATVTVDFLETEDDAKLPSPYQRLLRLTRQVVAQDKPAHLTELTVECTTNSVSRAVLGFNFWKREEVAK